MLTCEDRPLPAWQGLLCLLLVACVPVHEVTRNPVPTPEVLKTEDCALGARAYGRLLGAPAATPGAAADPDATQKVAAFQRDCEERLAGQARRVLLRCWHDAADAATLVSCNDRF